MKMPNLKGKKLYRSPKDAVVLGVCAGLAQYVEVDPVFVRLLVIALSFAFNVWPVAIAYLLAYLLMPMDPAQDTVAKKQEPRDVTPSAGSGQADKQESKKAGEPEKVERMDSAQNI